MFIYLTAGMQRLIYIYIYIYIYCMYKLKNIMQIILQLTMAIFKPIVWYTTIDWGRLQQDFWSLENIFTNNYVLLSQLFPRILFKTSSHTIHYTLRIGLSGVTFSFSIFKYISYHSTLIRYPTKHEKCANVYMWVVLLDYKLSVYFIVISREMTTNNPCI